MEDVAQGVLSDMSVCHQKAWKRLKWSKNNPVRVTTNKGLVLGLKTIPGK